MTVAPDRRLAWTLGVGLLLTYAYFYQAGGWNQNSRFALVRAVLEHHTVRIDPYSGQTGDRAVWHGHYYSDKAPGASFLAIPPVAAGRVLVRLAGIDPTSTNGIAWLSYVATIATSATLTVAAALAILWIAIAWGYSKSAALFAATGYAVAGPAWCYATLFMGHALAAGCLMIAFAGAIALPNIPPARERGVAWLVGVSAGWAVLSEFPASIPVALLIVLVFVSLRGRPAGDVAGVIGRILAGGFAVALLLFAYDAAAFGSPFHIGYASEEGFEQLRTGLFGITRPEWWRVREILVGSYRGLLPIAPLVAVAPIGLVMLARESRSRLPAVLAATIALFYLALNASYFYWEGGWAYGPRQVTPALPFVALGLAPLWDRWRGLGRWLLVLAWTWGTALTLVAVSTTPQPPGSMQRPVTELLLPAFRDGDLALNNQGFTDYRADGDALRTHAIPKAGWNLGMKLGLDGLPSLLPLALIWTIAGGFLFAAIRRPAATDTSELRA